MTLWSQENAKKILDRLCEKPSVSRASKVILGTNSKIVWAWARNSAADKANSIADSKYIITGWPDDSEESRPLYFHEAMEISRKIHGLNLDADQREDLGGMERPVIEGGKFQYVVDELAIAQWDNKEDAERIGGYVDWPYAHDERGARIVLTVREHVPAALKIQGLRAIMGDIWNVAEKREVDTNVSGGVMVLHGDAQEPSKQKLGMREDLETRLAAIRERNAKLAATPKPAPDGEVHIFRDMRTIDQPDDVPDRAPKQLPAPQAVADHPRAYSVPPLTPAIPKPQASSYAKPAPSLDTSFGGGRLREKPPGGFKVS